MGKINKKKFGKVSRKETLDEQILGSRYAQPSTRVKNRNRHEAPEVVDSKLTKKILSQAKRQQEDLEENVGLNISTPVPELVSLSADKLSVNEEKSNVNKCAIEALEKELSSLSAEDEKAFELFMPRDPAKRAALVDSIKDKMTEKETEMSTIYPESTHFNTETNERVSQVFRSCAPLMATYRSGKLPKPIKAMPKFQNWEQLLNFTEPEKWSAAAMYQATRIFSSNLPVKMAQRFYNLFLLPRLRDDIAECKKLNFHLYQALKKALFKPAAFFKGMIIPLCESGTCTLREAIIFGSVLSKCSVPILDSGAALMVISRLGYSGANSIFMRVLIEKKYALPFKVINGVVDHFMKFKTDQRRLPLFWHQCLLTFIQIYKNDLSTDQQTDLLRLLTVQSHEHIAPEIRKELLTKNEVSNLTKNDVTMENIPGASSSMQEEIFH